MYISEILSVHNSVSGANSHADILGDAFLMHNNSVYRSIKSRALKMGCNYVEASSEYLLMPFHQLDQIVLNEEIPYIPSAKLLQKIENKRADVLTVDDIKVPESYHMHEAAHVLAAKAFEGSELIAPDEKILKTIVCESFANTVDALAWAAVRDEVHHFFLWHNCYMHPTAGDLELISRAGKTFGGRLTFMLTLLSYVYANFLKDDFPKKLIEELYSQYAPTTKLSQQQIDEALALAAIATQMDPQFRLQTTKMYLNLEGYDGEVSELLDFPFMKIFNAKPEFRKAVDKMADMIEG